jgi:hypothetical protein
MVYHQRPLARYGWLMSRMISVKFNTHDFSTVEATIWHSRL